MSYYLVKHEGYLQHYGIKGQKWGLRRYQNEDRTLTPAGKERYRGLAKTFQNENKKLKKYERNADQSYQMQREAYHKRKAAKNARKAAVDAGIAVGATVGVDKLVDNRKNAMLNFADPQMAAFKKSVQTVVGAGFGAAAAIRAGKATYHALSASNAHRKASEVGHAKAVAKYQKQVDRMTKMFADTPYADLIKKQE